jgi:uncharacterized cupredoxin-like copper-binding protein
MTATHHPPTDEATQSLDEELAQLEAESGLAGRVRRLELSTSLTLLVSFFAVAFAAAALILAAINDNDGKSTSAGSAAPAASTGTRMHMSGTGMQIGVGGHGSFTAAMVAAAKRGTVDVQLGDFWVAPTVGSVRAGKVTFIAKNVGKAPHELMIERAPIKMTGSGTPVESAAQGMISDMDPGRSGRMTLKLAPGTYVLFCNIPGHYAAGQHIAFTVTKS